MRQLLQKFANRAFLAVSSDDVYQHMERERIKGEGAKNRHLSKEWVENIAKEFRQYYKQSESYRVFSRGYYENREEFRLNEYLYDIAVIKTGVVKSVLDNDLECPQEAIWLIESEFNTKDSRASLIDFGKLVIGSATNKALILPAGGRIEEWAMQHLPKIPAVAKDNWFICFVPHPGEWLKINRNKVLPRVYKLKYDR